MSTRALIRNGSTLPTVFEDFFKPWNEWFDNSSSALGRTLNMPAVNITETKEEFKLAFAVPGMKKDDFDVNVDGNMLTVSCEKEESKEEKEHQYTRKEYNYSSFSRSFSLPDEVSKDNIHASYTDRIGVWEEVLGRNMFGVWSPHPRPFPRKVKGVHFHPAYLAYPAARNLLNSLKL